jgi:thiosulfate/3-mercaptopyruvate sulfurtransferase
MPNSTRSAVAEYLSGPRIPNARRFDLDEVAELAPETNPLSLGHMMPTVERFAEECSELPMLLSSESLIDREIGDQRGRSCGSVRYPRRVLVSERAVYVQR